jgi:hypothetical protein
MHLTKSQFSDNLVCTIQELLPASPRHTLEQCRFVVVPCREPNVHYSSRDDSYSRWMLNDENLEKQVFTLAEVVNLLSLPNSSYPLWITVALQREAPPYVVELRISLRIRTPSQLQNTETGHPPFKVNRQ